jgi:hypothetical protein
VITAATAGNTIDSLNFGQIWNWSTATTQNPMTMTANGLTTGSLLNLTTSNGGVNSTNGLLNVSNSGASTSGLLAKFQSSSTAGSGMYITTSGNVGIGTTAPINALDVANGQGIRMAAGTPTNTTAALYNVGGSLYWNGAAVSAGGGSLGIGTQYGIPYYNTTTSTLSSAAATANNQVFTGMSAGSPVFSTATLTNTVMSFAGAGTLNTTAGNLNVQSASGSTTTLGAAGGASGVVIQSGTGNIAMTGGNVGIGTTTPANSLDIGNGGGLRLAAGTPGNTAAALYNAGGTLMWNGTSLATGASSQWTTSGSNIYYNTGNVGIGTSATNAKLDFGVSGNEVIRLYDGGATTNYGFGIKAFELQTFFPTNAHYSFNAGGDVQASGTNEIMRIMGTGNVGIGTTTPIATLDVNGNGHFNSNVGIGTNFAASPLYVQSTSGGLASGITVRNTSNATNAYSTVDLYNDASALSQITMTSSTFNANLAPANSLAVFAGGSGGVVLDAYNASAPIVFATGGSVAANERMRINSAGNIGIGTTAPVNALDIGNGGGLRLAAGTPGNTAAALYNAGGTLFWNGTAVGTAGGGSALSALTAATAANTIDSLNSAQVWNWSTATTQSPLSLSANALTTGSLLNLTTSNGSVNSTNGLLNVSNSGGSTNGLLAKFQSNSTAGSGVYITTNGTVGIGTTTPLNPATLNLDAGGTGTGDALIIGNSTKNLKLADTGGGLDINSTGQPIYFSGTQPVYFSTTGGVSFNGTFSQFPVTINGDGVSPSTSAVGAYPSNNGQFVIVGATSNIKRLAFGIDTTSATMSSTIQSWLQGTGGQNLLFNPSGGNVGIGTTNPVNGLDIAGGGGIHIAAGTPGSTAAALYNSSGTLYFNGSPLATGGGSQWTTNAPNIYYNSGNVGIGTSTPTAPLTVGAISTSNVSILANGTTTNANWGMEVVNTGGTVLTGVLGSTGGGLTGGSAYAGAMSTVGATPLQFAPNSTVAMTIASGGNVGIGTTVPVAPLNITSMPANGVAILTAGNSASNTEWGLEVTNPGGTLFTGVLANLGGGLNNGLPYGGAIATSGATPLQFGTNSTVQMTILANGNVGIGTTVPLNALDVNSGGGIHITSGTPGNTAAALYNAGGTLFWNGAAVGTAGGGSALSALTAATAANTIDSLNFAQTWNWSTASTQTAHTISSGATNNLTTGTLLNVTSSSSALNSTNGLLQVANTGASTNGLLAKFQSNSTAGSGMYVLNSGCVGIGTTAPAYTLQIAGTGYFGSDTTVNGSLNVNTNINTSGTISSYGGSISTSGGVATAYVAPVGATAVPAAPLINVGNSSNTNSTAAIYEMSVNNSQPLTQKAFMGAVSVAGATQYAPSIVFGQSTAASAYTERLRIDSNGNVGVGTTAPINALDIGSGQGLRLAAGTPTSTAAALYNAGGTLMWNGSAVGGAGGGSALSAITAATAANTMDSLNFAQAWNWSTATTQTAMSLTANGLSSGSVLSLGSSSTATTGSGSNKILNITASGANANASATRYGVYSNVTATGTTSTNVAGYFSATGATNNNALIVANGSVGIGTTLPTGPFDVEGGTVSYNALPITINGQNGAVAGSYSGGAVSITAGSGWIAGNLNLTAGAASNTNAFPGVVNIAGGLGQNSDGGAVSLTGGASSNGNGGAVTLAGGNSSTYPGGNINIGGGTGSTSGNVLLGYNGTTVTGNVGVGTTAPLAGLDVVGSMRLKPAALPGNAKAGMLAIDSGAANVLKFYNGTSWTAASGGGGGSLSGLTAGTAANTIDSLNFAQTWNWSTATTQSPLSISANALTTGSLLNLTTSNATVNSTKGLLQVANTGASTSGVLAGFQSNSTAGSGLYVTTNGRVGIGTNAPNYNLDVGGSAYFSGGVTAQNVQVTGGTVSFPPISFFSNSTAGLYNPGTNIIGFSTASTERMRIDANGNVGIGTTAPSRALDVNGFVRLEPAPGGNGGSSSVLWLDGGTGNSSGTLQNIGGSTTFSNNAIWNGYWEVDPNGYFGPQSQIAMTGVNGGGNIQFNVGGGNYVGSPITWTTAMQIGNNGNVGIGTTTPSQALEVAGNVKATAFISTSDRRLKTEIRQMAGLDIITKLTGVRYNWISNGQPDFGVIAQDVEAVLPEAVVTDATTGMKAVKYPNLVAPLIESTKELYGMCKDNSAKALDHERRIASLEESNKVLAAQNQKLDDENQKLKARLDAIEKKLGLAP